MGNFKLPLLLSLDDIRQCKQTSHHDGQCALLSPPLYSGKNSFEISKTLEVGKSRCVMQTVGVGSGQGGRWQCCSKAGTGNHPPMHRQISSPLPTYPLTLVTEPQIPDQTQVLDPRPQNPSSHHEPRIAGLRGQCFVGLVVRRGGWRALFEFQPCL